MTYNPEKYEKYVCTWSPLYTRSCLCVVNLLVTFVAKSKVRDLETCIATSELYVLQFQLNSKKWEGDKTSRRFLVMKLAWSITCDTLSVCV